MMKPTIVNACIADKENTVRATNNTELMLIASCAHIVLLYDAEFTLSRAVAAQSAFMAAGALSFKCVDEKFERQVLLTVQGWAG